ncbi:MAG: hypothetical protein HYV45_02080 [Candidatus Moranbacteria bacterium]|nr:hypothetical protein [Candidatus Moranbacteria bacterium]
MRESLAGYFSIKIFERATFIFFSLIFFSVAFFVFADDTLSTKNIFQDADQDGLSNEEEKLYGTDPHKKDTDGDGYSDGVEIESGYNPLKRAPGDKVTKESVATAEAKATATSGTEKENLTEEVSGEIARLVKRSHEQGEDISLEKIDMTVEKILNSSNEEVVLPEIELKDIKIKKVAKSLKEKKRKEKEREYAVEYLTIMSYLMANNMPQTFRTNEDLEKVLFSLSDNSLTAVSLGNAKYIDDLSQRGEKMLEELKDVEVPEKMLDVHVKALKMARYAVELKKDFRPADEDPLGQIEALSKMQGFIAGAFGFVDEINKKLADYEIEEIPLDL